MVFVNKFAAKIHFFMEIAYNQITDILTKILVSVRDIPMDACITVSISISMCSRRPRHALPTKET